MREARADMGSLVKGRILIKDKTGLGTLSVEHGQKFTWGRKRSMRKFGVQKLRELKAKIVRLISNRNARIQKKKSKPLSVSVMNGLFPPHLPLFFEDF